MRLSTRLFAAFGLVVLAGFGLVALPAYVVVRGNYVNRATERLEQAVQEKLPHLQNAAARGDRISLDQLCHQLNGDFQGRVSLLSPAGDVLGDSMSARCLERARPECIPGIQARRERMLEKYVPLNDTLTVRLPLSLGAAGPATVRLALPIKPVTGDARRMAGLLLAGACAALTLAMAMTAVLSRRIASPVESMTAAAEKIAQGNFGGDRELPTGNDEIGRLGEALNTMRRALKTNVTALQHERDQVLAIVATMSDGVLVMDRSGSTVLINAEAEALLGNRELAEGEGIEGKVPKEVADSLHAAVIKGVSDDFEFGSLEAGQRVLHVGVRPLQDGAVAVLRDMTDARRVESMGRELVANASHELRTPIAIIGSTVDTLLCEADQLPPHVVEFGQIISRQASRIEALVNESLQLSRLEANVDQVCFESLRLSDIATRVAAMHQPLAEREGVSLEVACPPPDEVEVLGVESQLFEAVSNLAVNALKYTPTGGHASIDISRNGDSIRVCVHDDGPGIAPVDRERIFQRFVRGANSANVTGTGSGLGLAIVSRIAELHYGRVELESTVGEGSCFTIVLPMHSPARHGAG